MGPGSACPSFAPWPTPTAATSTPHPAPTAASPSTCAYQPSPLTSGSIPRIETPHARPRHRNEAARTAQPNQNDHVFERGRRDLRIRPWEQDLARPSRPRMDRVSLGSAAATPLARRAPDEPRRPDLGVRDRKSTRLKSSHEWTSYA